MVFDISEQIGDAPTSEEFYVAIKHWLEDGITPSLTEPIEVKYIANEEEIK
jgi:hypothetical protein